MEQSPVNAIHDRLARAIGIPGFGIGIPQLAGLYGDLDPRDPMLWLGQLSFIGLAAAIWHGNRWLLFKQREHLDWFAQPVRKLVLLLFAIICYTAPLTILWLIGWYRVADFERIDQEAIRTVTLANIICVVFVTHAYETVFLIRDRQTDLVRLAKLERARTQAQLDALRAQVNPHFLFNSLNSLNWLIETDPRRAREFNETLARVYRYVLANRERDLVLVREELAFVDDYASLLRIRFAEHLRLETRTTQSGPEPDIDQSLTVPMALQLLVENAVKHNEVSADYPLRIEIEIGASVLRVTNAVRPRSHTRPSSGVGLANLAARIELMMRQPLHLIHNHTQFIATVPLVRLRG